MLAVVKRIVDRGFLQLHETRYLQIILLCTVIFNLFLVAHSTGRDEGAFLFIGRSINNGQIPYISYIDHKPPGIYYFIAGVLRVWDDVIFAKLSMFFVNILTATALLVICHRNLTYRIGLVSAIFYLFSLPLYQGTRILTEQFVALFGVSMVGLLLLANEQDLANYQTIMIQFCAGLLIGLAFLFKQPGVLFSVALAGYYVLELPNQYTRGIILGATGSLIPVLGMSLYLYHMGALSEAIRWVVLAQLPGGSYDSQGILTVLFVQKRNLVAASPLWLFVTAALIGYSSLRDKYGRQYTAWSLPLIVSAPILLFRSYPHYWIQLLPFAAVLGALSIDHFGPLIVSVIHEYDLISLFLSTMIILTVPMGATMGTLTVKNIDDTTQEERAVAQYIQSHSSPDDQILVLTAQPKYYYLSNRDSIGRNIYYLKVNQPQYSSDQLIRRINSRPPSVVVISECRSYLTSVCEIVHEQYSTNRRIGGVRVYSNPQF